MKTYESCGTLDVANKTVTVFTYLPNLPVNFRYTHFYNISTETYYGIVGILVNEGVNANFSNTPAVKPVTPSAVINLSQLDYRFSKIGFSQLTDEDKIAFFCWHDDEFRNDSLGVEEVLTLKKLQDELDNYKLVPIKKLSLAITDEMIPDYEKGDEEPKVGNGGVLTVAGSC